MSNSRKQQIENTEKASVTNVIFPLILIMLFFFAFAKSAKSQVAYVNYAAVGANDGTTWANAYPSLQTAIENAASGSQIWVARGTYKPAPPKVAVSTRLLVKTQLKNVSLLVP